MVDFDIEVDDTSVMMIEIYEIAKKIFPQTQSWSQLVKSVKSLLKHLKDPLVEDNKFSAVATFINQTDLNRGGV
jgi:hypothetical protein